jgi:hypothetical protein
MAQDNAREGQLLESLTPSVNAPLGQSHFSHSLTGRKIVYLISEHQCVQAILLSNSVKMGLALQKKEIAYD